MRASAQDGRYPRPQLLRPRWVDLGGEWEFDVDDGSPSLERVRGARRFPRTIVVPYPPEAPLSGIGDTGYHPVVWYRRRVSTDDLAAAGFTGDGRLLVHLGAVDYRADVWAGGIHVGHHEGGHTPFTVDVTDAATGAFDLVVRAEDDPLDLEQPRGKQDWEPDPHVIWYHRTTGIWQPVWLEAVARQHVAHLQWRPDAAAARVGLHVELAHAPEPGTAVRVVVEHGDQRLAEVTAIVGHQRGEVSVPLGVLRNGQDYERFLWSPERPVLLDAHVTVLSPEGDEVDTVHSYFGLRSVGVAGARFLLNDRPYPVRAVLSQGYWPQSHLAAPSAEALRDEVQLIKDLGFTTARLHQKIEDPRFLFWADRLGLLVWEELPSAYEFSATAGERLTREWLEAMRRDASHPCIAVWVPFNESWGVQQVASDERQQHLVRSLFHLTKALDGTRLVVSNDGWEHLDSDLLTVHDYENDAAVLEASYATTSAIAETVSGIGPGRRRMFVLPVDETPSIVGAPVVVSEFGGVSLEADPEGGTWGYRVVATSAELERQLRALFGALNASPAIAGWCYTQLTDTAQETNGLADEKRVPKLPAEVIRAMVRG